jgi:hypothetical protein
LASRPGEDSRGFGALREARLHDLGARQFADQIAGRVVVDMLEHLGGDDRVHRAVGELAQEAVFVEVLP